MSKSSWKDYQAWIREYLKAYDGGPFGNYKHLLNRLSATDYIPYYEMDRNRDGDGRNLRYIYGNAGDLYRKFCNNEITDYEKRDPEFYEENKHRLCSVLEMMVGFAFRIEGTYFNSTTDRTYIWFWMMIESLGLKGFKDGHWDHEAEDNDVDRILNEFMHNSYDELTGRACLFPITHICPNAKEYELWRQMEIYYEAQSMFLENIDPKEFEENY